MYNSVTWSAFTILCYRYQVWNFPKQKLYTHHTATSHLPSQALETTNLHSLSIDLLIWRFHINGTIHVFLTWLLLFSVCFQVSPTLEHVLVVHYFSWLSNIPQYGETTDSLCIYWLVDIWVVATFWWLKVTPRNICVLQTKWSRLVCDFIFMKYPEEANSTASESKLVLSGAEGKGGWGVTVWWTWSFFLR